MDSQRQPDYPLLAMVNVMNISFNHKYKVLKSTWGISIEIIGEITEYSCDKEYRQITCDYLCELPDYLNISEKEYIIKGLLFLHEDIKRILNCPQIVIIIRQVSYNVCDYQEDGLTAAIVDTISKSLCIDTVQINVDYDKNSNRYLFDITKH